MYKDTTNNILVLKLDTQTDELNSHKNDRYAREGMEDRLQAVITETDDQIAKITDLGPKMTNSQMN